MSKEWDYRVVRQTTEDGDEWYSVQEIYYDDETGEPMAHTMDLGIEGDTIAGMRTQLERMLKSLDESVVDESDIVKSPYHLSNGMPISEKDGTDYHTGPDGHYEKSMEERVLGLEMENAEMRDRLKELGDEIKERGL